MGYVYTLETLAGAITAAGVRAVLDRRDLNPPAALLTPDAVLRPTKLCGAGRLSVVIELFGRDVGDRPVLDQLEQMWDTVRPVLVAPLVTGAPSDADFTRAGTTDSPDQLPTLRCTVETPITAPTPT